MRTDRLTSPVFPSSRPRFHTGRFLLSSQHDEEDFPPGHHERRQVSNAMLAFQIDTLSQSVTGQMALLREMFKDLGITLNARLDKHDTVLVEIQKDIARIDTRTTTLEEAKREQEALQAKSNERSLIELATARAGSASNDFNTRLAKIAFGILSVVVSALAIYAAIGGH